MYTEQPEVLTETTVQNYYRYRKNNGGLNCKHKSHLLTDVKPALF